MVLNFSSRINSYKDQFSAIEQRIADYLLKNASKASLMSIQELAIACDTSISTLSRFSKKIGCQNYQQLRMLLNNVDQVNAQTFFKTVSKSDSLLNIATSHFHSCVNSLFQTQKALTENDLQSAVDILKGAHTCGVFGTGGSSIVAHNMYYRFIRSSLPCLFSPDLHMQLMLAAKLESHDCALVVSHTGKNLDTLRIVRILKENEVPIIALTSNPASTIARESTMSLITVSEETKYRPEAIDSLVPQMTIVDTLFMLYSLKVESDGGYFSKIRRVISETRERPKKQ